MRRHELIVGRDERWGWDAPAPLVEASTPTLEVIAEGDRWTPALTAIRAEVVVNAIDDDGYVLTATAPVTGDRIAGDDGEVFLISADGQVTECRVGRFAGNTVYLAKPLPRPVHIANDARGRLQWRRWSAELVAEEPDETPGPTATVRNLAWRVVYSELGPGGASRSRRDEGTIYVTPRHAWTGVTLARFRRAIPEAAYREGRRETLQGPLEQALEELIAHIEAQLPRTMNAADVFNLRSFAAPHIDLARARMPKVDPDVADQWQRKALELADKLLARVLQANGGGEAPESRPRRTRRHLELGGSMPTTTRRFYRGMDR